MNPEQARDEVVRWLRDGGAPNEVIPFKYEYTSPRAERGLACAGAAFAYLMDERDASEAERHFEGNETQIFFNVSIMFEVYDTQAMADHVQSLTIKPCSAPPAVQV